MRVRIIGYVPLDKDETVYRAGRSGYGWQTQDQAGYHPPRIYQKRGTAESQSPIGEARQVLMVLDDVTEEDITTGFPV
jgi:hypothetical protein